MPAGGWNNKFLAAAGAGGANAALLGAVDPGALAAVLRRGYATAATDNGHEGANLSFAQGHPEKLTDFAYRAVHEMTVKAKAIIAAYYGTGPKLSYWSACAAGGRAGLKEAQHFPTDYDAIAVVAPASNWTHLQAWSLWIYQLTHKDESAFIPASKFPMIHQAVLDKCDALDGAKDGVIEAPGRCKFDPGVLLCKDETDSPSCLTAGQVETARKIYAPVRNSQTKKEIFPGLEPGSELGWAGLAAPPQPFFYATETFKYMVFKDPTWDYKTFDLDRDVASADKADKGNFNATDPGINKFLARGGKLLLYTGWSDPLIPPQDLVNYYESVLSRSSNINNPQDSIRLFMVPGMGHCGGGTGPNTIDAVEVIDQWRDNGKVPNQIVASHVTNNGTVDRTRPLCPYPQVATYQGTGSTDIAENFVCRLP